MTLAPRITLVTLGVADVAASTAFYRRLGWKLSSASNDHVSFFDLDGAKLGLFGRQALADDAHVENAAPAFSGVTLAINYNSEAEVDEAYAHALACGAREAKRPEKVFWGGYSGYFADPDGHLWELAFNPYMPLGEDGQMMLPE